MPTLMASMPRCCALDIDGTRVTDRLEFEFRSQPKCTEAQATDIWEAKASFAQDS